MAETGSGGQVGETAPAISDRIAECMGQAHSAQPHLELFVRRRWLGEWATLILRYGVLAEYVAGRRIVVDG